jgi:tetratricopeptide (TPR) repeat protein/TolB-like protein
MAERAKFRPEDDRPIEAGLRTLTKDGSSSSNLPSSSDSPTLIDQGLSSSNSALSMAGVYQQSTPTLRIGTVLGGRYAILDVIGQGGMGAVYKAEDRALNRLVALKVIRPELAADPEMLQRFKQEILLASKVSNRNVIRIYDLGDAEGFKFVTMQYLEGEDLRTLLRSRGKLPAKEAVGIIEQVLSGLQSAHQESVIHRDLKPANIMLDPQGRVVVMDFGLARTFAGDGMTRTGMLVGTMEYMSPEQAQGKDLEATSDIFAVGIIFFELLTGKLPYAAQSAVASLIKRTTERATPISDIDRTIPGALSNIVGKCLERDPALRYQSAAEVLDDLHAWEGNAPLSVRSTAHRIPQRITKLGARRVTWSAAAVLAVILIVTAVWYTARPKKLVGAPHAPVSILVADLDNTTSDPVFDGTLESVFNTELETVSFVNAYKRGSAHRIASQLSPGSKMDEAVARLVARREGISVIVSGSIARQGEGYRVSAKAIDAVSGKQIAEREITVDNRDAVLSAIAKLVAPVRTAIGDTTPESAQLAAEESFTTSSLDAAHLYSMGQDAVERGQLDHAIQDYQKAVQYDPNLGRAWAGLAVASVNLKKMSEADTYYKRTLGLLDRMSERERYRTLGTYYAAFLHNYPQAVETYHKLVYLYPGDTAAYNNLSIAYVFMLDFPKAIEAVRHAVENNPHNLQWRLNYALYSMYAGDFATATSESQRIIQENPSYQFAYLPLAISTLARGDPDGARAIYTRFEKLSPDVFSLAKMGEADLEMYFGHYRNTLDTLNIGIKADQKNKNTGEMALKYVAEAEAYLALGQKTEAIKAVRKAAQLNPDESVAYPAARVFIQVGDDGEARKIASALDNTLQTQSRSYSQLIAGEIDMQHRHLPQAIEELRQGQKLHDSWISHFLLGRVYLGAMHYPEALAEFETCKKRLGETTDLMFADTATLRYLPPLYYWLARAQEGAGMNSAARESYQQFLKLRVEADPGDSLVVEAKKSAGGMSQ